MWTDEATAAFTALKAVVTSAPVLALPDFGRPFVVECDASTHGFGAVLLQDKHPIAYFSRSVTLCHHSLAANGNSSASSTPSATGARTYGVVNSRCGRTTTA
jgi:hypothetical protein